MFSAKSKKGKQISTWAALGGKSLAMK